MLLLLKTVDDALDPPVPDDNLGILGISEPNDEADDPVEEDKVGAFGIFKALVDELEPEADGKFGMLEISEPNEDPDEPVADDNVGMLGIFNALDGALEPPAAGILGISEVNDEVADCFTDETLGTLGTAMLDDPLAVPEEPNAAPVAIPKMAAPAATAPPPLKPDEEEAALKASLAEDICWLILEALLTMLLANSFDAADGILSPPKEDSGIDLGNKSSSFKPYRCLSGPRRCFNAVTFSDCDLFEAGLESSNCTI